MRRAGARRSRGVREMSGQMLTDDRRHEDRRDKVQIANLVVHAGRRKNLPAVLNAAIRITRAQRSVRRGIFGGCVVLHDVTALVATRIAGGSRRGLITAQASAHRADSDLQKDRKQSKGDGGFG